MNVSTANSEIRILVIDGEQPTRALTAGVLSKEGYQVDQAASEEEAIALLKQAPVDLVITDLRVGNESGLDIIRFAQALNRETECVLVAACGTIENAIEATGSLSFDYLSKPFSNRCLILKVQKAVERRVMKQEITLLRQHVAMSYGFDNIVGISRQMIQIKETARRIAETDITVLITGPSGTGKELLARTIHHHSSRRNGKFVTVDCSAIPEAVLEAELFGYIRDTFAMEGTSRKGLFEEADGGTLFLDEVSTMPMSVQAKLLLFLQDSEIRPVGASASRKVNVRVLAATNRDLRGMVGAGTFREDLYFRLNIIPLLLPPLSDRAEDLEMLIEYFLRKISHEMKERTLSISRQAVDKLLGHTWPGNVRELENTLKRGAALCAGDRIDVNDIIFIAGDKPAQAEPERPTKMTLTFKGGKLDSEQRTLILKTLSNNSWNFTRTAQELGIGRTTLWRKIKKYNLQQQGERSTVEV